MSETTSPRSRPIEELEAAIFETIEPYFEGYLKEVQESKGRVGAGFCKYEEARQQVANVEMELEQICQRTEEIMAAEVLNSVVEAEKAYDLKKEVFSTDWSSVFRGKDLCY